MTSYRNDPRWITAKYAGTDARGKAFPKGTRAFYYPGSRTLLTGEAAMQASRDFEAARQDEEMYA